MPFPVWRKNHNAALTFFKNPSNSQRPNVSSSIIEYHCSILTIQDSNWNLIYRISSFDHSTFLCLSHQLWLSNCVRWLFPIDKVLNSLPDPTPLFDISCGPCTSKLRTSVEPQIQKVKNAEEIVLPVLLLSAYQAVCSDASAHLQTNARNKHQQSWYAKVLCKAATLCIPEASILCLLSKETETSESSDLGRWARKFQKMEKLRTDSFMVQTIEQIQVNIISNTCEYPIYFYLAYMLS